LKEQSIQNSILATLGANNIYALRINSGNFWGGEVKSHDGQYLLLEHPTKIQGAPAGTSDIICCKTVIITPEMIGRRIGIFCCLEIKQPGEKPKKHQENYLAVMRARGAIAGWATSPAEALEILK
jgi:hypothetical protein